MGNHFHSTPQSPLPPSPVENLDGLANDARDLAERANSLAARCGLKPGGIAPDAIVESRATPSERTPG